MRSRHSLLIMTEDSPLSFSPAGERVRHMALAGEQFFDKVSVLALGVSKSCLKKQVSSRALLHELKWRRGLPYPISGFFDPVKALLFFLYGLLLAKSGNCDYVLVSVPPVEAGVSAWVVAKLMRRKLIVDLRDDVESYMEANLTRYIPMELIRPLLELMKRVYSSGEAIFAATQTIVNTTRERKVGTSVRYVPNGADTSLFRPRSEDRDRIRKEYSLPSNRTIFVYVGSGINVYYRLDAVLHAVKALPEAVKERVFCLFYVYDGMRNLNRLKDDLKITNSLAEIREPLHRRSLAEVLAACDAGFVPFDDRSYLLCARSTKLYEYLSSGECIVCSGPTGGELDSLTSAYPELGVFTQPTVKGFAQAISRIVDNAQAFTSDDLRSLRHRYVQDHFDRRKIMQKAMKALLD